MQTNKLREALEKVIEIANKEWDASRETSAMWEIWEICKAALSAPPRNCDLPEVAKDPWRAWLDDESNWDEDGNPKLEIHDWLFAPATEKKGGANG